jgi:RNA-binding protein
MALTGKQIRHLRALGHHLNPLVHLGKEGITDSLTQAVNQCLTDHELVKVKLNPEASVERTEAANALATALKADVAQVLGRTVLIYRRHPNKPTIKFP